MKRADQRQALELRGREARMGEQAHMDGSAWLAFGGTVVVASVTGPVAPPRLAMEQFDAAVVTVAVQHADAIPQGGSASRYITERNRAARLQEEAELGELVRNVLSAVIMVQDFPRTVFAVALHVISRDGGVASAAVNAAVSAVLDAGIPCRTTVAAIDLALLPSTNVEGDADLTANGTQLLVLDPTAAEETEAAARATFVFALPATGGRVVASRVWGNAKRGALLTPARYCKLEAIAESAAASLFDFFRECHAPAAAVEDVAEEVVV